MLSLTGRLYRYEFDNILMIYAQKPHSTLVADYDTWKKVDRYVKRGSKGHESQYHTRPAHSVPVLSHIPCEVLQNLFPTEH